LLVINAYVEIIKMRKYVTVMPNQSVRFPSLLQLFTGFSSFSMCRFAERISSLSLVGLSPYWKIFPENSTVIELYETRKFLVVFKTSSPLVFILSHLNPTPISKSYSPNSALILHSQLCLGY